MKKILTIAFVLAAIGVGFAQPSNNECINAINIPYPFPFTSPICGAPGAFTNLNATPSTPFVIPAGAPPNWFPAANAVQKDVWFEFTIPPGNPADIILTIEGCSPTPFQPKFALYVGNCNFLVQVNSGTPVSGSNPTNFLQQTILGLPPGAQYFLRVDNGVLPTPISGGEFTVSIAEYCAPINMANGSSNFCNDACILYDSGGPLANYGEGQNLTYTICPPNPQGCLRIDFTSYDIDCLGDALFIYDGTTISPANLVTTVKGTGTNLTVEVPSGCATLRFQSNADGLTGTGWALSWECLSTPCTPIPISDCNNATPVTALPFTGGFSTCGAGNNYDATDACGSPYMNADDYVFVYNSPGGECISIALSNTAIETGLFVMNGCPNADATSCIASAEASSGNPVLNTVQLEQAGDYYIVISGSGCPACTDFTIDVTPAPCPMQVNPNVTAQDLAQKIAGYNVDITNIQLNCPPGAYGTFEGGPAGVNIQGGIILSTGFAIDAEGPNVLDGTLAFPGQDANTPIGSPGDPQLSNSVSPPVSTIDACILEFDVYAPTDLLSFNFSFMSEEYLEFVGSVYNDIFGFWVRGPGILDGNTDSLISAIPGTTTPIRVSSVNNNTNNTYYINNPAGETSTAYDGYTTLLTASAPVTPCNIYHLRMAIADGIDQFFDSGVLIEEGSLFNQGVRLEIAGASVGNALSTAENCQDGSITISLVSPQADTVFVPLDIQGTAQNGIDYGLIPSVLVFPPGVTSITFPVLPTVDGIVEGQEYIVIYIYDDCSGENPSDSAIIYIQDDIDGQFALPATATICGAPIQLPLTSLTPTGMFYAWSPTTGLSNPSIRNPIASPTQNTTYTVIAGNGICYDTLSIDVLVATVQVSPDTLICTPGEAVSIFAVTNQPNATWSWTPTTGLSSSTIANPVATPQVTTTYNVTISTPVCVIDTSITISVFTGTAVVAADQIICEGVDAVQIGAAQQPGYTYEWSPALGLDDAFSQNPTASPSVTTAYTLTAMQAHCSASSTMTVTVGGSFFIDSIPDQTIFQGDVLNITANPIPLAGTNSSIGSLSYVWSPTTGLSGTNNQVSASPEQTTTYTVSATSFAGCTAFETFTITVIPPDFAFPNAFAPASPTANHQVFKPIIKGNVQVTNLQVFNRWGGLVFDNGDPTIGWDGRVNGEDSPQDTYIYVATLTLPTGEVIEVKGDVLLLR